MQARILIILCFVFSLSEEIFADSENGVKRGAYPFMAIIYYPDETVVDAEGMRFLRSAVLIRPEWLVTSAAGLSIDDGNTKGFPRNTLLARAGTITIDANITLNEDEDEQEREIIQIVRPYNHSATQWWRTDISMMKTLLPFNVTASVGVGTINFKREYEEKTCIILIYTTRYGNRTEDRILMELSVDLLPSSMKTCGRYYVANTMICSSDSDENKNAVYDSKSFCQGNSGGPLICDDKVIGLQTYIEKNCKQPHLYQLLSAWEDFITCSTEEKCQEEQCANICTVTNKDASTIQTTSTTSKPTHLTTVRITQSSEKITTSIATIEELIEVTDKQSEIEKTPTLTSTVSTERSTTESETQSTSIETIVTTENSEAPIKTIDKEPSDSNDNYERKKLNEDDDVERKIHVEAQQQDVKIKKTHSASQMNVCLFQTLLFAFLGLVCLI